jgi:glycosyltransferase involved in cell wall biosynthesis
MDKGGGNNVATNILKYFKEREYHIEPLSWTDSDVDFDTLFVFGCTYHNPEMLNFFKKAGVNVIVFSIFDRVKPKWQYQILKPLGYLPIQNTFSLRREIFEAATTIIVSNEDEKKDIVELYNAPQKSIVLIPYAIQNDIFEKDETITKDLFYDQYGWKDFVFCPAAVISKRKNQMTLIQAIKGSGIKLVLTGCDQIHDNLKDKFEKLIAGDKNILALPKVSRDMLISIYKSAKTSISVSLAETGGLVNLEAAYLGCNLVVSDLAALHEYLGKYALYINPMDEKSILEAIRKSLATEYDKSVKSYVKTKYSYKKYIDEIEKLI